MGEPTLRIETSGRSARGPWLGICFALAALALVQAWAYPPGTALARFREECVLPVARVAWAHAMDAAERAAVLAESEFGIDPREALARAKREAASRLEHP